jgi:hypothetical protein
MTAWKTLSGKRFPALGGAQLPLLVATTTPVWAHGRPDGDQAPAADLMATLTVSAAEDGASLLRVDLNDTRSVERVRIRLSRPELGEDLLDTRPSGDGGWLLGGTEVALPGAWHAVVVVRRTNIFDDARAAFDFSVDPLSGAPAF